ncbi:hypothetical protein GCM10023156_10700 [Novipirellula rosea]|uniref:Uncharacterized protein n=1 Tax=Novipirellula rosea TaxID=1031540 RepID=A0ABP8MEY2_9BACT
MILIPVAFGAESVTNIVSSADSKPMVPTKWSFMSRYRSGGRCLNSTEVQPVVTEHMTKQNSSPNGLKTVLTRRHGGVRMGSLMEWVVRSNPVSA